MAKANFTVETVPGFVFLEDLGTGMTITNDAEQVVRWLAETGVLDGALRVLYRDSLGTWDELLQKDGRFAGFAPVNAPTRELALAAARRTGDRKVMADAELEASGTKRVSVDAKGLRHRARDRGRER